MIGRQRILKIVGLLYRQFGVDRTRRDERRTERVGIVIQHYSGAPIVSRPGGVIFQLGARRGMRREQFVVSPECQRPDPVRLDRRLEFFFESNDTVGDLRCPCRPILFDVVGDSRLQQEFELGVSFEQRRLVEPTRLDATPTGGVACPSDDVVYDVVDVGGHQQIKPW